MMSPLHPKPVPPVRIERRYALLTSAYLMGIYWLSSLPDLSSPKQDPLTLFLMNLGHLPLFAVLAFCVLKTFKAVGTPWWPRYALAFAASAACAALDEWHQSFVPGRSSSVGDFLVDVLGIVAMLFLLRLLAIRTERRRSLSAPPPSGASNPTGPVGVRSRFPVAAPAHAPCMGPRR
jgi:VanZ family protein